MDGFGVKFIPRCFMNPIVLIIDRRHLCHRRSFGPYQLQPIVTWEFGIKNGNIDLYFKETVTILLKFISHQRVTLKYQVLEYTILIILTKQSTVKKQQ